MKNTVLILFLFAVKVGVAQVPDKAEDVSPLLNGEKLPFVELKSIDNKAISVQKLVSKKPTILILYRGGWCPYCNVHLAQLRDVENVLIKMGFQIIAVSPDSPNNLKVSRNEENLNYQLLSDADMNFSRKLGIAFKAPNRNKALLKRSSEGKNPGYLPVPSVFIVDKDGTILFEYINPNYNVRITSDLLIAAARSLKQL